MANYDKDEQIVQISLKTLIVNLMGLCEAACAADDPVLYNKAIRTASLIEDKLWQYYMEVYNK